MITSINSRARRGALRIAAAAGGLLPFPAFAADGPATPGDIAWMLAASALVLFMTLPGLALFYGGLVRAKNVLSVLMHCFASAASCRCCGRWSATAWPSPATAADAGRPRARPSSAGSARRRAGQRPPGERVFAMFQMTFAIITPALIIGAYAERVKFAVPAAVQPRCGCSLVYAPVAHWVWGGGWLARAGHDRFRRRHRGAHHGRASRRWSSRWCSGRAAVSRTPAAAAQTRP